MKTLKTVLVALALVLLAAYTGSGVYHSFYTPERSSTYLWAAYHVHSTMSDGLLPPEGIARQARSAGVSLVILTDHGGPNLKSSAFRKVIDGVTIVGGSEASLPEGHFTFFGAAEVPLFKLPPFPPAALDDVREWGAFPVLAYPEDPRQRWRYWEDDLSPGGVEVANLFTSILRLSVMDRVLVALYYPFSKYYFLKHFFFPAESLASWDNFLRRQKTWGLLASDAHGGYHVGSFLTVPVPSYAATFSLAALGMDRRYSPAPEDAIRRGDFFNCVRGAGEPQLFEFSASHGGEKFAGGSSLPAPADLHARVRALKLRVRLVLKKDGVIVREASGESMDFPEAGPGVYRVEAYLQGHPLLSSDVPWILSNPIFVGHLSAGPPPGSASVPINIRALNLADLQAGTDTESRASYTIVGGAGQFNYHLADCWEGGPNRWCALGYQKPLDLSGTKGFYIQAFSNRYLRYFVELRSRDRRHYASFKVYPGKETLCRVPYEQFYRVNGGRGPLPLQSIESVFIIVSNYSSSGGFEAILRIREMGFY